MATHQLHLFDDVPVTPDGTAKVSTKAKHEDYEGFVNKFQDKAKPKLTTDDCMTPAPVYDAIANWVAGNYRLERKNFVRPFWPGADFTSFDYQPEHIVVDNPPFSIEAKICRWYQERDIKFFLFCSALTAFNTGNEAVCTLCAGASITYENGARVPTSFVTNLEEAGIRSAVTLYHTIEVVNNWNDYCSGRRVALPKYEYPPYVMTAAMLNQLSKYGIPFKASANEIYRVRELDTMKSVLTGRTQRKTEIFGSGYLLSEAKAEELARAKEQLKPEAIMWQLSDREMEIIKRLGKASASENPSSEQVTSD